MGTFGPFRKGEDVDRLIYVLLHSGTQSNSNEKRLDAAIRLGTLRDPRAIPALLQAARELGSSPVSMADGGTLYVQVEATRALGKIGGPEAVEALSKLLRQSRGGIQDASVEALKRLGALDILQRYYRFRSQCWKALVMDGGGQICRVEEALEQGADGVYRRAIPPGDYVRVEYSVGEVNSHGEHWKAVVRGSWGGWGGIVDLNARKLCLQDTFNGYSTIDLAGEPVQLLPAQKESLKRYFSDSIGSRLTEEVENILR